VELQKQLEELPHLAMALKAFLGGSMKMSYTSKVKSTPEPQAPLNVAAADLIDEIGDVIDRAEDTVLALVQMPAEPFVVWVKGRPRDRYLDGVDRALDIGRVHRKASKVVGLHETWQRRHAPCPSCEQQSLGGFIGTNIIQCTNEDCQIQMDLDEYEKWCVIKARE